MVIGFAAILCATIGQDAQHRQPLRLEEWQHPVIEEIRRRDGGFSGIELSKGHFGVSIDKGLLVNPPYALERTNVEGIL